MREEIKSKRRTKRKIEKMRNKIKIIVDDPSEEDALYFQGYSENLADIIKGTKPKFAVGIFGKWGTGKTTLMRMVKRELDKDSDKVLTVWFDAWRYEREKYLAVIPFLRQIIIALRKDIAKNRKTSKWDILTEGLEKTFTAFIESTELSITVPGSNVSLSGSMSLKKFMDSFRSKDSSYIDGEQVRFHEHVTEHLENALNELNKENPDSRIVVFVDDLDRCTPEKALEVLESIKAFFDIKGVVYVIAMDSESIDHIITQKYGEKSNINGMKYLEKIVQLPFQIPVWKHEDMPAYISKIILKGLEGSELLAEFEKEDRKNLVVRAIEPNPRQVKRFVNNIILARAVFGEGIDIDSLIAVQALNFRPEWNMFLALISKDDKTRVDFFKEHYFTLKGNGKSITNQDALKNYIKEQDTANRPLSKEMIDIFQELIKEGSEREANYSLSDLLDAGADEILRDIEKMEEYRRALESTKVEEEKPPAGIRESTEVETRLGLLKTGRVKEFNEIRHQYNYPLVHSFPDADLSGVVLGHAILTGADFTGANLTGANLGAAYLLRAKLLRANLSDAYLFRTDLTGANLTSADITGAKLLTANLTTATLTEANLTSADLTNAILRNADLIRANLSGADLSGADLTSAKLHHSILVGVRHEPDNPICEDADFKDAIIDDERLSNDLTERRAKNVPPALKSKKELREKLETTGLSSSLIEHVLSQSRLQTE